MVRLLADIPEYEWLCLEHLAKACRVDLDVVADADGQTAYQLVRRLSYRSVEELAEALPLFFPVRAAVQPIMAEYRAHVEAAVIQALSQVGTKREE
jgi:hypothetical protein